MHKRKIAWLLASTLMITSVSAWGSGMEANAQQVSGNAPFVNTWLVSGPFDTPVAESIYNAGGQENAEVQQESAEEPEKTEEAAAGENTAYENIAGLASVSASSSWQTNAYDYPSDSPSPNFVPQKAVDGSMDTEWIAQMHDTLGDPSMWPAWDPKPMFTLDWSTDVEVKEVHFYDRHADGWPDGTSDIQEVKVSLLDKDEQVLAEQTVTDIDPKAAAPGKAVFKEAVKNVDKITLEIIYDGEKNAKNTGLGFKEVEVYGAEELDDGGETGVQIDPSLGTSLEYGDESGEWEYFDDRIYNRNYDDYQDLSGYYTTKQGIDTKNKFVYAHTYIYSDKQQRAQVRVGASGSYKVYFNDREISEASVPAEVQKDMTVKTVTLREGWNKLLIQIEHTYTEDVNENGVPIAKDYHVSYLGFYGRITDTSGNKIDGLNYSVEEGSEDKLEITTQGLKDAEGLPDNTMPTGYKEWPYVWNKSTTDNAYGLSASAFQFMAEGGTPGYTWEIVEGSLPDGLELNPDGTIADGLGENGKPDLNSDKGIIPADCEEGDYSFTLQVTDAAGNTAKKDFTITVEERPNKWFEEGRVSALSHDIVIPTYFIDPNYSADLWAERAKLQGHSLVSIEALQQNYYWSSKFADPRHIRNLYMPKDENGQVVDGLKQFEEAVKRYGMKFGLYYATEGGGLQHFSTDVFVQNVADLIERYDPAYLYFDGPQAMKSANYDVMYSNVRNYSNDIIINSNAWGEEYGDPDLATGEASHIYSNVTANHFVKKVVVEPWKSILTKNNLPSAYAKRDDYVQVAKEMIMNVGRGYVDNNDQMPICKRGPNWDSPESIATTYPMAIQEYIDIRDNLAAWFAPEGYTERHESTTGTTPYFLSGYGYEDDGKGNYNNFAFPSAGIGPQWGYAVSRDNNIYLHIIEGPDSKKGVAAIEDDTLTISPVADKVEKVIWLNKDEDVAGFEQKGDTLTIDLSNVEEDEVDTIIKIVTDSKEREYKLTDVYVEGEANEDGTLRLKTEGQMTYPALKADLETIEYEVSGDSVTVDENGLVTPVGDGTAVVTVTGTYEGESISEDITVTVKDGEAFADNEMLSAVLHVDDREVYGEFSCYGAYELSVEGRAAEGGAVGINDAEITWHTGTVDLDGGDEYTPVNITENDVLRVVDGKVIPKQVDEQTRAVIWADVTKNGKTYTTNRVFMDLRPAADLAKDAVITASENEDMIPNLTDGKTVTGSVFDASKWTAEGTSWLAFELPETTNISEIDIDFNTKDQNYINIPETIEIQTSEDGKEWKTEQTVNGPTGGAYVGFYTPYEVDLNTKYVRLQFTGRNGGASDIMEIQLMGDDVGNTLSEIELNPEVSEDQDKVTVGIKGFDRTGTEVDLSGAEIRIISEDTGIADVAEDNSIYAVNPGRTKVTVQVSAGIGYAENWFYVTVDENGKLQLLPYLSDVQLEAGEYRAAYESPVVMKPVLTLSNGESVPAAEAEITYVTGNELLEQVEGTNTLIVKEEPELGFKTTVKAVAAYDGVTVESEAVTVDVSGRNLAPSAAQVTTSSVFGGDRYPGENALDGDKTTHWASEVGDKSPWIRLDFDSAVEIGSVNIVDRGHDVNEIREGVLEFFDENGDVIYSRNVTGIEWENTPDNIVTLENPVTAYGVKFTIDPGQKYYHEGSARGMVEFQLFAPEKETEKTVVETLGADVTTEQGVIPAMPENVTVVYNTGETENVAVTWNEITAEDVAEAGSFTVEGTIAATGLKVTAVVTVVESGTPAEPADKTLLQKSYDYALTLSTDGVAESAKEFFEKAMAEAKAVLDDPDAAQEEVNAAWDNLLEGIWGLGLVKGDTAMLEMLIGRAEAMVAEADRYVEDNWQQLTDALAEAKEVCADGDALQGDVEEASDALLNAILAQRYKANKDNLQSLVDSLADIDLSKYTEESVQVFKTALAQANAVLADATLSTDDQAKVDAAAEELAAARDGLAAKTDDTGDGSGDNGSGNGSSDGSSAENGNSGNKAAKTGDNANIALIVVVMIAAAAAGGIAIVRKRRKF